MWRITLFLAFCISAAIPPATLGQAGQSTAEQDYAFASGLFRDRNFRLAYEEFLSVTAKYPEHGLALDAQYYAAECQYQQSYFTDADTRFAAFCQQYPKSRLADDALFRRGEIAYRNGDYRPAFSLFERAIQEYPDENMAHEAAYWTGESALQLGDYSRAKHYYTIAYEQFPEGRIRDYAAFSIAYVDEREGRIDEAIGKYQTFTEEFPESTLKATVLTRLGAGRFAKKDYRGCIAWLEGLADSPDPDNAAERLYLRGEARYQLAEYVEAAQHYQDFLNAYPAHPRARSVRYALGWCHLELRKYTEAAVCFDSASHGTDELAEAAYYRKGTVLRLDGKPELAQTVFETIVNRNPTGAYTDNALFELGMNAYAAERYSEALGRFERVIDLFPKSDIRRDAWFMAGETMMKLKRPAEAAPLFDAVASDTASSLIRTNARFRLGHAHFEAGRFRLSVEAFSRFLAEHPLDERSAEAQLWRAEALFHLGRFMEAVQAYAAAFDGAKSTAMRQDALYGKAWSQYSAGRYREAEATFTRLTTEFRGGKQDVDAQVRLADAQYAQKRFYDAAKSYRQVVKQHPRHMLMPYAMLQLGNAEHRAGDTPAGTATLQSLLATHSSSDVADKAQYSLAWFLFEGKSYEKAIGEFRNVESRYPSSALVPQAVYAIGDCYYNLGRYADAEAAYADLVKRFPESSLVASALEGISQSRAISGKPEAVSYPSRWLLENPNAPGSDDVTLAIAKKMRGEGSTADVSSMLAGFGNRFPESPLIAEALLLHAANYRERRLLDSARIVLAPLLDPSVDAATLEDARFESARIAFEEQDPERAIGIFDALERQDLIRHSLTELHYLRGKAQLMAGNEDKALADFTQARSTGDDMEHADKATIETARITAKRASADSAIAMLAPIASSRIDDTGAEAQFRTGEILSLAGRYAEAEKALLRVGYIYPESIEWAGHALLYVGDLQDKKHIDGKPGDTYRRLLDKYPGCEAAAEARTRLERVR